MGRLPPPDKLTELLADVAVMVRPQKGKGRVADYIPALSQVSPDRFGMTVITVGGEESSTGDANIPFSLQSITKVPALILALNTNGDEIWERVGKEPSGTPFNYLAQLEAEHGIPRNPFVNAGALTVTDYLIDRLGNPAGAVRDFLKIVSQTDDVWIDETVAESEFGHAYQNKAIANILALHGTINNDPDLVLKAYCRQCAIHMSVVALTRAFLPLASGGFSPILGESVVTTRIARRVNALMMMCGMYDAVGSFAYRVGLPAKSGVGGGIVAIAPGVASIGVWAPELDRSGNSLLGTLALEQFVQATDLSLL